MSASAADAFLAWLREAGVDTRSLDWPATFESADDRGVAAAVALAAGVEVMRIPERIMLVPARCLEDPELTQLRARLRAPHSGPPLDLDDTDDLVLALFLLVEVARGLAGAPGQWWPYVRVLPSAAAFSCLLRSWTASEVALCADPQMSAAHADACARAASEWAAIEQAVFGGGGGDGPPSSLPLLRSTLSRASFGWALACVHSRAFVYGLGVNDLFVCPGTSDLLPIAMVPMVRRRGGRGAPCARRDRCLPPRMSSRCACATTAPTPPPRARATGWKGVEEGREGWEGACTSCARRGR